MTRQRLEFLLRLLKINDLNESQWTELMHSFGDNEFRDLLTSDILQALKEKQAHESWTPASEKEVWDKIVSSTSIKSDPIQSDPIQKEISVVPITDIPIRGIPSRRIQILRRASVAAAILILISGTYFYLNNKIQKPTLAQIPTPTDIKAPQINRATITLSSGQSIFLDSAANGQLALQNNVKLIKTAEGTISYDGSSPIQNTALIFNTLTNPKGSRVIDMELSDGTHVWLNAGSSLTYPVAFTGYERNVEITGEAYFEVSHNPSMPFTVKKSNSDTKIQVLGTHFNVNAYDDESSIKITLLEGSVKVSSGNKNSIIRPGQQANINNSEIKINSYVDTEEVMAWKNGKFQFGDASDIASIMREIARWYDVEVVYQGSITGHIGGSIPRDVNASQVFKMLETTGTVKFKIEGKKVTVMPAP